MRTHQGPSTRVSPHEIRTQTPTKLFEHDTWLRLGGTERLVPVNDTLPDLDSMQVLSGNISSDWELLSRTYATLGTRCERSSWIETQQELARTRLTLLQTEMGIRLLHTPTGVLDAPLITSDGDGIIVPYADFPVVTIVYPADSDQCITQFGVSPLSNYNQDLVSLLRRHDYQGLLLPDAVVTIGAHAHNRAPVQEVVDGIIPQLALGGIKTDNVFYSSVDTITNPSRFSDMDYTLRFGRLAAAVAITRPIPDTRGVS